MKIIVTHMSPDWDAIGSVWLIKKYLAGWQEAVVKFVPAGERIKDQRSKIKDQKDNPIEIIGEDEVIHVDTGMGPLDHHQISDTNVSAMSLTWECIQKEIEKQGNEFTPEHMEAVSRIVKIIVDIDHFKEVFWKDAAADYHEFSLLGLLDGVKYERPDRDNYYVEFGIMCLNAIVIEFENRIWAEKEIAEGRKFMTRYGPAIGFETLNDTVLKLAQKMGYVIVVRKDPRKKYVRIKAIPAYKEESGSKDSPKGTSFKEAAQEARIKIPPTPFNKGGAEGRGFKRDINLTLAYEKLKKIDPDATWYLHVSGKMLLNGTPKNPKMRPTKLSLIEIIKVLEKV